MPWIGVLIEQLHGQVGKRSFASSWVWLDVLEAVSLLAVSRLLSRKHRATSPVSAATAAILCMALGRPSRQPAASRAVARIPPNMSG